MEITKQVTLTNLNPHYRASGKSLEVTWAKFCRGLPWIFFKCEGCPLVKIGCRRRFGSVLLTALILISCGGGGVTLPPPATLAVSPRTATILTSATQQLTATLTGISNQGVAWSVNGVLGGNATVGTIDSTGLYIAPAIPPSPNTVTARATSIADPTLAGSASITINNPSPTLSSISPNQVSVGSGDTTITASGLGFARQSSLQFNGSPTTTTFVSSVQLTAVVLSSKLTAGGAYSATVSTPTPGGGVSAPVTLTVIQPPTITSSSNTTLVAGTAGSFTVKAAGFPAPTLSETGTLPTGVTFNAANGALSGTPGAGTGGTYNITFKASNGIGADATQDFTLTVNEAPTFTSAGSATFTVGTVGSFTVTATGFPAPTVGQAGTLPSGVTFDATTGVLSGTPGTVTGGTYNLSFSASNGVGTDVTQNFVLTVANPVPTITSLTPTSINSGSPDMTVAITGTGFVPTSVAQANSTDLATTFVSSTQLSATIPAAMLVNAASLTVTVTTPSPGGGTSGGSGFQVLAVVTVSPTSPTVVTDQSQTFSASVSGTSDQAVTWSIQGAGAGNTTVGTISASGVYTAPGIVPNPPTVTIQATSSFDNVSTGTTTVTVTSPVEDWTKYRRDLSNTGRSGETGLSSANVSLLKKKWSFTTPGGQVSATPAVASINGTRMVFVGSWNGTFYALNATTGAEVWTFTIDTVPATGSCATTPIDCTRIASSAAVANGDVYFGAGNGYVYGLDAATGSKIWGTQLGDPTQGVEIWTSPAVYNGVVYVAAASHNDEPCVPGKVVALNASTGAIAWTFDATDPTVPGVGIWSSPAIDTSVSPAIVYIGTGNPGNSCVPAATGTPSFSYPDGILGLNASTGALISFFPAITNDSNDCCDFGSSPVLHTTSQCTLSGVTAWITEANKNGSVFTLPRGSTGAPSTSLPPVDLGALGSGELIASPALIPGTTSTDCNHIYIPSESGYLYDLQQAGDGTGTVLRNMNSPWPVPINISGGCATPGNCPLYSAPAAITDILLFGGGEGNFYAYSMSGQKLFSFGTFGLVTSGPAISDSRVYFGSYGPKNSTTGLRDGTVYCLSINGQ
jgi:outer membrane protein assembly factor BamB